MSKLTENGCGVKFTKRGGTITTASGTRVPFQRKGGVRVITADVGPWSGGAAVSTVTTKAGPPSAESIESKSPGFDATRKATSFQRQG